MGYLEPSDIAFNEICQLVTENNWILEECILENIKNRKHQLITTFTIYFLDKKNQSIKKKYKMIDDQYLWLASHLSREFPDAIVIDARTHKPGNDRKVNRL